MKGHPLAHCHAHAGDFAAVYPHAGAVNAQLWLKPEEAYHRGNGGQQFFHIQVQVFLPQADNGIGHKLAGAVKCRHAAAFHPVEAHALTLQLFLGHVQMGRCAAAPHGDDGVVLKQQQGIVHGIADARLHAALLKVQGFAVFDAPKIQHLQRNRLAGRGAGIGILLAKG